MYKRMLVPLDGSKLSEAVFPYARELAGRLDLEIILLHVISSEEQGKTHLYQSYIGHKVDILKCQSEEVQKKETEAGAKCTPIKVKSEITSGYPAEEIIRYAEENDTDFILLATHGRSGIRRWVIGSVAEKVLRASNVPVWLARAAIPEETVYDKWLKRTTLVPLDGSKLAESVLPHVEALAKQRGTEIVNVVLLRVCEPAGMPVYYPPNVPIMPKDYVKLKTAADKAEAENYLAKIEKQLKDASLNVQSKVLVGDPAGQIIDHADKNPLNLIVMSTHARSGLDRWTFGSVADKVLHKASSPIFLVRPQQPSE